MIEILQLIKTFDFHTLMGTGVLFLFLKKYMDKKFDKIDERFKNIDERFEKMDAKFTKKIEDLDAKFTKKIEDLDLKVINIDKRLVSIETILHFKEGCVLKDHRLKEEAE